MDALAPLVALLRGRRFVVLAGAGLSTESGIPDYRGPETGRIARRPIQHQQFVREPELRRRYWARSVQGWPLIAGARPNAGHRALARLERAGPLLGVVTQNVDSLHHRAGSRNVIELHGALDRVTCLACGATSGRGLLQERLLALNPGFRAPPRVEIAPDGDAMLADAALAGFRVAACLACGGTLMPDVVFFGGTVPSPRVEAARGLCAQAQLLLVVGSSLTVYSGFRFVREASARGQPVAILNRGPTRGDPLAALKVEAPCGAALTALADALCGPA